MDLQLDATTIAAATLPLWMPLRPPSTSPQDLARCHEFVCLEQLINAVIIADEIEVPNLPMLQNGSEFARRFLLRDPMVGHHAATYALEASGVVGRTLSPIFNRNLLRQPSNAPEIISNLQTELACVVQKPAFLNAVVQQIIDSQHVDVLSDIKSVAGYSAPQNPFGHSFTDGIEWQFIVDELKAQPHYPVARLQLESAIQGVLQAETLPWVSAFALRGILYGEFALIRGVPYIPHPLRLPQMLASISLWTGQASQAFTVPINLIKSVRNSLLSLCVEPVRDLFNVALPPLLATIFRRCESRDEVLSLALELRRSRQGAGLRRLADQCVQYIVNRDSTGLVKISGDVRRMAEALAKELGIVDETIQANLSIFGTDVRVPRLLSKSFYPFNRAMGAVYEVSKGLTSIASTDKDIRRLFIERS